MRGAVYYNSKLAGYLEKVIETEGINYLFTYTNEYLNDNNLPAISLTLSKRQQSYSASILFPFFQGLLAEGINKEIQCRLLKIDENDDFRRLLQTAGDDTIGAITVKPA